MLRILKGIRVEGLFSNGEGCKLALSAATARLSSWQELGFATTAQGAESAALGGSSGRTGAHPAMTSKRQITGHPPRDKPGPDLCCRVA